MKYKITTEYHAIEKEHEKYIGHKIIEVWEDLDKDLLNHKLIEVLDVYLDEDRNPKAPSAEEYREHLMDFSLAFSDEELKEYETKFKNAFEAYKNIIEILKTHNDDSSDFIMIKNLDWINTKLTVEGYT